MEREAPRRAGFPIALFLLLCLIPGTNPAAFDLPFYHGVSNIVYVLQLEFFCHQFVQLKIILHCHVNVSRDVEMGGDRAIEIPHDSLLMKREQPKGKICCLVKGGNTGYNDSTTYTGRPPCLDDRTRIPYGLKGILDTTAGNFLDSSVPGLPSHYR